MSSRMRDGSARILLSSLFPDGPMGAGLKKTDSACIQQQNSRVVGLITRFEVVDMKLRTFGLILVMLLGMPIGANGNQSEYSCPGRDSCRIFLHDYE